MVSFEFCLFLFEFGELHGITRNAFIFDVISTDLIAKGCSAMFLWKSMRSDKCGAARLVVFI